MKKRTGAVLAALAVAAATALALAAGSSARQQAPIKAAWIYVGPHNDGGWSQAHDRGRLAVQKALGTNVDHDVQGVRARGAAGRPGDRQPRQGREQDHLRDVVRVHGRHGRGGEEVPGRVLRARDRVQDREELRQLLRRRRRRDLPVRHRGRGGDEEGCRRLHRPVPDPGDHPACERLRARRPGSASRSEGQAGLDEVVVRSGQGEEGRREPRSGRRRRGRTERRQSGRRAVRAVEGAAVGRVQQQLAEVRADLVARRPGSTTGARTT